MIPQSVAIRHRGSYDFESCYSNLCALQDSVPLANVKAHLKKGILDINGDKVRMMDWSPILNAIKINKSLRYIALRSYFQQSSNRNGKKAHYFKRRTPAICMKDVTLWIARALSSCLSSTKSLRCIDLQGVPLREKDIQVLSKGISKNVTLTHILLDYCQISDPGVTLLCQALKHHLTVTHVSLAGCNITPDGVEAIARLIKHQSTQRCSDAWAESLRYRVPNLNCMGGIRRITLNSNPLISDTSAQLFAEALKDDLWLKALDLQQCGLSSEGANALLATMKFNNTITVLDIRQNPMVDIPVLRNVLGKALQNANEKDEADYPWIKEEPPKDPYKTRQHRAVRNLNRTFCKKSVVSKKSATPEGTHMKVAPGRKGYVPWRTAVRASQHLRGYSDDESEDSIEVLHLAKDKELATVEAIVAGSADESRLLGAASMKDAERQLKTLKIDLLDTQRRLERAQQNENKLNEKILVLRTKNSRLKKELNASLENSRLKSQIDDEVLLDSIDQSFSKFHEFLNMLNELGLGSLAAAAGLDQLSNPFDCTVDKDFSVNRGTTSKQVVQDSHPVEKPIVIQGTNHDPVSSKVDSKTKETSVSCKDKNCDDVAGDISEENTQNLLSNEDF